MAFAIDYEGPPRARARLVADIQEIDPAAPELLEIARANDNAALVAAPVAEDDYQRALRSGSFNAKAAIARRETARLDHASLFKNWDDVAPKSKPAPDAAYDYKAIIGEQIVSRLNEQGADIFYSAKKNKNGIRLNYDKDDIKNEFVAAAAAIAVRDGKISIAAVKRSLHVGDKRAKEIVQKLYDIGFVGEYDHKLKGRAYKKQTASPGTDGTALRRFDECAFREMPRSAQVVAAPVASGKSTAIAVAAAIAIVGAGVAWGVSHDTPSSVIRTGTPVVSPSIGAAATAQAGVQSPQIFAYASVPKARLQIASAASSPNANAPMTGGMIAFTPASKPDADIKFAAGGGIGMAGMEKAWAFAPAVEANFGSVCQSPTPEIKREQVRFAIEEGKAFGEERAKALLLQHPERLGNVQLIEAVNAKTTVEKMVSTAYEELPTAVPADVANVVAKDFPDACKRFIQNLKAVAAYRPPTPNCEDGPIYKGKNIYILHCLANFSALGYEIRNGTLVRDKGPSVAMGKSFKDATKSVVMAAVRKAASPLRRVASLRLQKALG